MPLPALPVVAAFVGKNLAVGAAVTAGGYAANQLFDMNQKKKETSDLSKFQNGKYVNG